MDNKLNELSHFAITMLGSEFDRNGPSTENQQQSQLKVQELGTISEEEDGNPAQTVEGTRERLKRLEELGRELKGEAEEDRKSSTIGGRESEEGAVRRRSGEGSWRNWTGDGEGSAGGEAEAAKSTGQKTLFRVRER